MTHISRKKTRAIVFAISTCAAIGIACDRRDEPTRPSPSAGNSRTVAPWRADTSRPGERHVADIAQRVPSFGGFFLTADGVLSGYVASDKDVGLANAELNRVAFDTLLTRGWKIRHPAVQILHGQYSYRDLSTWRDAITQNVLGTLSVEWDDIDFSHNRIRVGVFRDDFTRGVELTRASLAKMNIPPDAVAFFEAGHLASAVGTGKAEFAMMMSTDDSLNSKSSTLMGGLIKFGYGPCSAGLVVDYSGTRRMIIDSHCTTVEYTVDSTRFTDGDPVTPDTIGTETHDPSGTSCSIGGPTLSCRYSEQVLVTIRSGKSTRRGAVARTTGSPSSSWVNGGHSATLVRSTTHPFFAVTAIGGGTTQGQTVYKMGSWSGWTYGTVSSTCADRVIAAAPRPNFIVRCMVSANAPSHPGDSGGPLFTWDGSCDCIGVVGFLTGTDSTTQDSTFPYYDRFVTDLGFSLTATTDITVGTPSISGSTTSMCSQTIAHLSWSAVSGTNSPYSPTYSVYRNIDGGAWSLISYGLSGTGFDDCDQAVTTYAGASMPPGASVGYYIVASNPVSASSNIVYFNR